MNRDLCGLDRLIGWLTHNTLIIILSMTEESEGSQQLMVKLDNC